MHCNVICIREISMLSFISKYLVSCTHMLTQLLNVWFTLGFYCIFNLFGNESKNVPSNIQAASLMCQQTRTKLNRTHTKRRVFEKLQWIYIEDTASSTTRCCRRFTLSFFVIVLLVHLYVGTLGDALFFCLPLETIYFHGTYRTQYSQYIKETKSFQRIAQM